MPRADFERVLVTGGAGFIGSHLAERLLWEGCKVTVLDDFSKGRIANLNKSLGSPNLTVVRGDVNDSPLLSKLLDGVEVVFHEAALVSVQQSLMEPELTHHVNVGGTKNVLQRAIEAGVRRLIFASSAAVYGDSAVLPITEDTPLAPISPYAKSKVEGEKLCAEFRSTYGICTVALRYFNVYGPRSQSGMYSGVINALAQNITRGTRPVIYGDGLQSRDFVHVSDVVQANMLAASRKEACGEIFNVGTGIATTIRQLVEVESAILGGNNNPIDFRQKKPGDVNESKADITRIRRSMGFEPTILLETGLRDYLTSLTGEN